MNPIRLHRSYSRLSRVPSSRAVGALAVSLLSTASAFAQNQSLAFTGGVLLNTSVQFRGLGRHASTSQPGPATGGAIDRTYDNGYNRVDATGNAGDTTVHYGYRSTSQIGIGGLALTSASADGSVSIDDTSDFIDPSANLEYRGSLGNWGEADWGVILGIGYQAVDGEASGSFVTDASVIEDHFSLGTTAREDMPIGPYAGTASGTAPRIGSIPSRNLRTAAGSRLLNGSWEFTSELIPVTGGIYLETQIAGRLNAIVSAGMLAMFVNAELRYQETSTIGVLPSVTSRAADGTNDFILGGFVQLGVDWALWEKASIVAGARWQPTESFSHSVEGRTAELDFTTAFAVHAGFSLRF